MYSNSVNAADSSNFSKTPREAAEAGFKRFLDSESFNKQIGFSSTAEALSSVIGEGFQECYIKKGLAERTHSTNITDIMGQYDSWEFMVMSRGRAKALVTVVKKDGHWQAVGLGGPVGDAMQKVASSWPASAGYSLRLIDGAPLRMNSLVVVSKAGVTVGVVILSFTIKNRVVVDDPVKLSSEKDAINYIKETLKRQR
jgi:hypothetical protein